MYYINIVFIFFCVFPYIDSMEDSEILSQKQKAKSMFDHAYFNYMRHAFPHDELKPLSASYTDSWGELGNAKSKGNSYNGISLSLIESLSTLAVLDMREEFARGVEYLIKNISFDLDLRVHVFESNIRLLGGLISAHQLSADPSLHLIENYQGGLLSMAEDLGNRLLPAFNTSSGLPYGWVHLQQGMLANETASTCPAAAGTLLLEFGLLSHLTGDMKYWNVAFGALQAIWNLRSDIGLWGGAVSAKTGVWIDNVAHIGSGIDSLYEYLLKSYALFGIDDFYKMFASSYTSVYKYLKFHDWYIQVNKDSGLPTYFQFNSLQGFWPGMEAILGNLDTAILTQRAFYSIWKRYGAFPEAYILNKDVIHPTETYYPLRPEITESIYHLFRATNNHYFLELGKEIINNLIKITQVEHGFASIKDVKTGLLEDRMSSFFLSETCKYLYLLFDHSNWVNLRKNILFTTEGHIFFIDSAIHKTFQDISMKNFTSSIQKSEYSNIYYEPSCPYFPSDEILKLTRSRSFNFDLPVPQQLYQQSINFETQTGNYEVKSGEGSFHVINIFSTERIYITGLGSLFLEITRINKEYESESIVIYLPHDESPNFTSIVETKLLLNTPQNCCSNLSAILGSFGPQDYLFPFSKNIIIPHNKYGCNMEYLDESFSDYSGYIFLVERGECTFIQKALNAQNLGADGLIVVNNKDEPPLFVMGGDVQASREISIPSIMISKLDSLHLKKCFETSPIGVNFHSSRYNLDDISWFAGKLDNFQINSYTGWGVRIIRKNNGLFLLNII